MTDWPIIIRIVIVVVSVDFCSIFSIKMGMIFCGHPVCLLRNCCEWLWEGWGCCDKSVEWRTGQLLHSCLLFVKLQSTVQHFCSRLNVIISAVYSNNNRKSRHGTFKIWREFLNRTEKHRKVDLDLKTAVIRWESDARDILLLANAERKCWFVSE